VRQSNKLWAQGKVAPLKEEGLGGSGARRAYPPVPHRLPVRAQGSEKVLGVNPRQFSFPAHFLEEGFSKGCRHLVNGE